MKGALASQQFVECHAKAENIGAMISVPPANLQADLKVRESGAVFFTDPDSPASRAEGLAHPRAIVTWDTVLRTK